MKSLPIILQSTLFALFLSISNGFAQATDPFKNNPFVENSLNSLNTDDLIEQNLVAKSIVFKGVTDQRIYQKLSELIQQNMANGNFKELSWLAIGLASSGDEQYRPLLEGLLTKSKGRSKAHIKRALRDLKDNHYLNSIAAKDAYIGNSKLVEKNEFTRHVLARLNSDNLDFQKQAVKLLRNKGIQEKRVYNRIGELITQYSTDSDSENDIYLAWLVEGLAYSGNKDYLPIIENMPKNISERVDRHVRGTRKIFNRQEVINPILAREDLYTGQEKWESIRNANFVLFSNEYKRIKRFAQNAIIKKRFDPVVFNAINYRILSDYKTVIKEKGKLGAYGHWMKAFTYFPSAEYDETIQLVSKSAANEKLREYASTAHIRIEY